MNNDKAKKIVDYIFKDVFETENPYTLSEFQNKFAIDIPQTRSVICDLSGKKTWAFVSPDEKVASMEAIADQYKKDAWMKPKRLLEAMDDILKAWQEINYQTTEKYINSNDVIESDAIYTSNNVHRSVAIFDSKNIVFSYKLSDCDYMAASRDNSSCRLGIRVKESIFCSSGFEISWSNKISKSMFIHDSYDLYECLFCSHLRSKKFCIANIQFSEEEYFKLKKEVIKWILGTK